MPRGDDSARAATGYRFYATLAEKERRSISIRTKQALAAAKARGVQLGNPKQAKTNKHEADRYAKVLRLPGRFDGTALSERGGRRQRACEQDRP